MDPIQELKAALGDHRAGGRSDGVWDAFWSGPASVAGLADLGIPELVLELLPDPPAPEQLEALESLGYTEVAHGPGWLTYDRVGGPRLQLLSHQQGRPFAQQLLWTYLRHDADARVRYRQRSASLGREAADAATLPEAQAAHVAATGFGPVQELAALLEGFPGPWMVAAGWALDLHLGQPSRPHQDLDVEVPRHAQPEVKACLEAARLQGQAVRDGAYAAWTSLLEPPHHQVHVHRPGHPMLDVMLTDFVDGLWLYRPDPSITLPLDRARRFTPDGVPHLAPEAVLLFKSRWHGGQPRGKDEADFRRVLPRLDGQGRDWLAAHLPAGHRWHAELTG